MRRWTRMSAVVLGISISAWASTEKDSNSPEILPAFKDFTGDRTPGIESGPRYEDVSAYEPDLDDLEVSPEVWQSDQVKVSQD